MEAYGKITVCVQHDYITAVLGRHERLKSEFGNFESFLNEIRNTFDDLARLPPNFIPQLWYSGAGGTRNIIWSDDALRHAMDGKKTDIRIHVGRILIREDNNSSGFKGQVEKLEGEVRALREDVDHLRSLMNEHIKICPVALKQETPSSLPTPRRHEVPQNISDVIKKPSTSGFTRGETTVKLEGEDEPQED